MWVLTGEVNRYEQCGEYFVAAFARKPSAKRLNNLLGEPSLTAHLLNGEGGGRAKVNGQIAGDAWLNLKQVGDGELSAGEFAGELPGIAADFRHQKSLTLPPPQVNPSETRPYSRRLAPASFDDSDFVDEDRPY